MAAFASLIRDRKFWVALFAAFEVVLNRAFIALDLRKRGMLSDLIVFFLLFSLISILPSRKPWKYIGLGLLTIFGLLSISNAMYFSFYHTFLHLGMFGQAGDLASVMPSLAAILSPGFIVFWIAIPAALIVGIFLNWDHNQSRRVAVAVGSSLFVVGTIFLFVWNTVRTPVFNLRETNFTVNLTAQAYGKLSRAIMPSRHLRDAADVLSKARSIFAKPIEKHSTDVVGGNTKTQRNLVIVVMESVRASEMGAYGSPSSVTPVLDGLAAQGRLYKNFYANGTQTSPGEIAINCSILPYFGGGQIFSQFPNLKAHCLAQILSENGYDTHLFIGHEESFAGTGYFERGHGFKHIHDWNTMPPGTVKFGMGARDEDVMRNAVKKMASMPQPFFAEIITLSGHHPFPYDYEVTKPADIEGAPKIFNLYRHGIRYTDRSVGVLMDEARRLGIADNTIFAFVADHGVWFFANDEISPIEKVEQFYRIPFIVYGNGIGAKKISNVASQIDIAPTLMEILGISADNSFMGSAIGDGNERFAILMHEMSWNIRRGDEYCYNVGRSCFSEVEPKCPFGKDIEEGSFTCFRSKGDLLTGSSKPELLNMQSSKDLMGLGEDIIDASNWLIENNSLTLVGKTSPKPSKILVQ